MRPALIASSLLSLALAFPSTADAAERGSKPAARSAREAPKLQRTSAAAAAEPADVVTYGRRSDLVAFAEGVAQRHGLDGEMLVAQLAQSRYLPSVARLIMPPPAGSAKNWQAYRARFVEPIRVRAGQAFRETHAVWLERAESLYGVPESIILGIIGVETLYGRHMGSFRTLDALATLAFDFPAGRRDRSAFFRDELEHFLVLCSRQRLDPTTVLGSYAGAIGIPQFMPSSILRYAIDFDGDGRIDLRGNPADAIGSVANYLSAFGWKPGMPTHFAVQAPTEVTDRAVLLAPDILPSFGAQEMVDRGARLEPAALSHAGKLALVELQNGEAAPSHVAGTTNFYAITRYNWSSYYAMAVIELGRAITGR